MWHAGESVGTKVPHESGLDVHVHRPGSLYCLDPARSGARCCWGEDFFGLLLFWLNLFVVRCASGEGGFQSGPEAEVDVPFCDLVVQDLAGA